MNSYKKILTYTKRETRKKVRRREFTGRGGIKVKARQS